MFDLPLDLQRIIFEYDGTFREHYSRVMNELLEMYCLIKLFRRRTYDLIISEKECKRILRFVKKGQLRQLAYFTKTRLPRKITKRRLALKIVFGTKFFKNILI